MRLNEGDKVLEITEFGGSTLLTVTRVHRHMQGKQCVAHYAQLSNGLRLRRNQKDPGNLETYPWGKKINNTEKTTYELV